MDRNVDPDKDSLTDDVSLSARRAWIEIMIHQPKKKSTRVALRKESVDRNAKIGGSNQTIIRSLSARRAWIEMSQNRVLPLPEPPVALRKESVDRNDLYCCTDYRTHMSLSARRAWIEIFYYADRDCDWVRSLSARRAWIEITTYFDTSSIDDCRSPQGERG